MSFRVMSFNIRGAFHKNDGLNAWNQRAVLNVQTIRRYSPDLIGFQELQTGNLQVYQAELTDYSYLLGNNVSGEPPEYPAIFWKPARFDLLASGGFWLSETPDVYSGSWDTNCVRAMTWARFLDKADGAQFVHLNTHLDHVSHWARTEGLRLILSRLNDLRCAERGDLPTILTGDFNCNACDREHVVSAADDNYCFLLDSGFTDTFLAGGNSDSVASYTFHGFQGDQFVREGTTRIDWIMTLDGAQRFRVLSSSILRDHAAPLYPSDHYPVMAELAFE
jgi:endonuclease/exonuclease/phosphatase family metal-dependent hydrolase